MTNIFTFEIGLILPLSKHKNCPLSLSFSFSPLERSNLSLSSIYITLPRAPLTVRTSKKKKIQANQSNDPRDSTAIPFCTRESNHRPRERVHTGYTSTGPRLSSLLPPPPRVCLSTCVCVYIPAANQVVVEGGGRSNAGR